MSDALHGTLFEQFSRGFELDNGKIENQIKFTIVFRSPGKDALPVTKSTFLRPSYEEVFIKMVSDFAIAERKVLQRAIFRTASFLTAHRHQGL